VRRAVELHWPALLAGSACAGLALSNWIAVSVLAAGALALAALAGVALLDSAARVGALAVVLTAAGLWWGSLRLDAMDASALATEVGESGSAELVATGPARQTLWAVRVPAEVRSFRGEQLRERVLLVLPVGRSPPRGAILEASVRVVEPRASENGFDERAWLARQGIHVILRGGAWRQVGARGGLAGLGDRLRDRIEHAVGRGVVGVRRALVLGVVLGEDEGLTERVRQDFRASGLAHLLGDSAFSRKSEDRRVRQSRARSFGTVFQSGWMEAHVFSGDLRENAGRRRQDSLTPVPSSSRRRTFSSASVTGRPSG
jgi:competence protein ComEC